MIAGMVAHPHTTDPSGWPATVVVIVATVVAVAGVFEVVRRKL